MKIKNWFKTLLSGFAIGFGSAVPGVSGGTIAVIFGVYEKIIWAVSHLFKCFKEAFRVLLPTILGLVIGLVPAIILMDKALNGFVFGVICIFAGFIIGSLPGIKDEVKDIKPSKKHNIALVVALLFAVGLGVSSVVAKADVSSFIYGETPFWFYIVLIPVGVIASIALVVPGLSGSMLLLLLGFYNPLLSYTKSVAEECVHGNWNSFGHLVLLLVCFAIGVIIGFYLISKLMHFLLAKFHDITFFAILGFVIGSIPALFCNYEIFYNKTDGYMVWASGGQGYLPYYIEVPIGVALLVLTMIGSYMLVRLKRKRN